MLARRCDEVGEIGAVEVGLEGGSRGTGGLLHGESGLAPDWLRNERPGVSQDLTIGVAGEQEGPEPQNRCAAY